MSCIISGIRWFKRYFIFIFIEQFIQRVDGLNILTVMMKIFVIHFA
jgi:hypothetical protein